METNVTHAILSNVRLDAALADTGIPGSFRIGTAEISLADIRQRFGPPHDNGDGDKVTATWYFTTPRGPVELRDYWWNAKGQQSLAADNVRAVRWLAGALRRLGIPAWLGVKKKG